MSARVGRAGCDPLKSWEDESRAFLARQRAWEEYQQARQLEALGTWGFHVPLFAEIEELRATYMKRRKSFMILLCLDACWFLLLLLGACDGHSLLLHMDAALTLGLTFLLPLLWVVVGCPILQLGPLANSWRNSAPWWRLGGRPTSPSTCLGCFACGEVRFWLPAPCCPHCTDRTCRVFFMDVPIFKYLPTLVVGAVVSRPPPCTRFCPPLIFVHLSGDRLSVLPGGRGADAPDSHPTHHATFGGPTTRQHVDDSWGTVHSPLLFLCTFSTVCVHGQCFPYCGRLPSWPSLFGLSVVAGCLVKLLALQLEEDATLERRMIGAFPFPGLEGPNGHDESHDEDEAEESSSSSSSTGSSMSSLDRPRTVLLANPGPHPLPLMVTVSSSSVLSGDGGGPSSAQQPSQEPVVSSSRPLSSIPAEEDAEDQRSRSQLLGQIPRSDAAV